MSETEARKLCTERGRDPDRDMTNAYGHMKAWEMYDTVPGRFRDGMTETQARERCYKRLTALHSAGWQCPHSE